MAIYTRRGDQGQTQVIGSRRRFKDDARVQAFGTIDEAGALLGVVVSLLSDSTQNA
ncbi:MAG: cob(I)yrinic acid a,c-diamide adenosyltransferase, partial [Sulfobacillus sp.]